MIILNDFGKAIWRHKYCKHIVAERAYSWVDRVIIIDEYEDSRKCIDDIPFSNLNLDDWVPVTKEEYAELITER